MKTMKKAIMNTNIYYKYSDIGKDFTIVLLHGWGQNISMMEPIGKFYYDYFNILEIDLPGFGKSDEPNYVWSVFDYAKAINILIKKLKIKEVIMIGHSFGGKIALAYASKYKTYKLICFASPYCSEMTKLSFKTKIYKKLKKINMLKPLAKLMSKKIGSTDYKNASMIMRGVLVKSINIDMIDDIKKINCPTLLIWGDKDTAVPLKRAYELNNLIHDSAVIVYKEKTHYAYLEELDKTIKILDSFFKIKRKDL